MEQKHKEAIRSNFSSLVERTDLDSVVTSLYEKGVFSEPMIEPYRIISLPERDRKRQLYVDILRRGPLAFGHLVDTLGELGYWDLVRDLDPDSPFSFPGQRTFNPIPKLNPPTTGNDNFHSLSRPKGDVNKNPRQSSPPPAPAPHQSSDNDNAACDVTIEPPFTVVKSTKFMEDNDTKDVRLYRTRGRNRGVLLDFTYMKFDNDIEEFRNGVDVDCNNLKYLFNELGFRVLRYLNLTMAETTETLRSLDAVLVDIESVFVVVSSHGYERAHSSDTDVRCKDGKLMRLMDIIDYFNNRNLPALIGVPKVFIFQMCRGSSRDHAWTDAAPAPPHMRMPDGVLYATDGVLYDGQPVQPAAADRQLSRGRRELPLYSDILIAHSTLPGLVAHRDGKFGSWYIQVLCKVFAERAHDCHVEKLFTLVDKRLQAEFKVQTSSVDRWGFNKRLYLHPGLYES
nr:caspase Dronc [Helicoverpa armigera]